MKRLNLNSQHLATYFSLIVLLTLFALQTMASSHREAPLIAHDPLADNTDLYAFRSPDNPNTVTIIANYIPMQLPHGGPNYYSFGENVHYEIHIDNDVNTPGDDITYRFSFTRTNEDPTTFFNIRLGAQNLKTTYTLEKSTDGGNTFTTIVSNGVVPPPNIGPRSINSAAGLNTTYQTLFNDAIMTASSGEKVFCGPIEDPFFVDLGGVFDLGDLPRTAGISNGPPRDGLACYNVHTIAIQVDISDLQKDGQDVSQAANILDPDYVIGVWASASRQRVKTLNGDGTQSFSGPWVQVSRLGMPLTNEVVVPIGDKDYWNSITPYDELDDTVLDQYFYNPELALYMDTAFFASAVPAFSPLRIQRNTLQAFNFGNGNDGLFPLKGDAALNGTALDDAVFGNLLLPGPGMPRSVDLWPVFHTGVPNLAPYQLATGKPADSPLADGKPFINNFLPNGGDMLRLNMAVPVTQRNDPAFSSLGIIQAAVLGLTDTTYNGSAAMQFIPNMDGFPNGRRLEDDVTRIELQAVAGAALAAIGLWYDDYQAGQGNSPLTPDLLGVLGYSTGVEENDTTFRTTFPYVQLPWVGTGKCGGKPIQYNQPPVLPPTAICDSHMVMLAGGGTSDTICIDGQPDFLHFDSTAQASAKFTYIITDANDSILGIPPGDMQNFDPAGPGECHVYGVSYTDSLIASPGNHISSVTATGCLILSDNYINVVRVDSGGPCANVCSSNPLAVTGLTLVNADSDADVSSLMDGDTIDLATISSIAVRADVCVNGNTESVKFVVNGSTMSVENIAPYAIAGDNNGDYNSWNVSAGTYTIQAIPYSNDGAGGMAGVSKTVTITIINSNVCAGNGLAVTDLVLVNANTNSDITSLMNGDTIDLSVTSSISIRADVCVNGDVQSVKFVIDGNTFSIENAEPYAIAGDNNGNYHKWNITAGTYTIEAIPYDGWKASGTEGTGKTITITVVNGPAGNPCAGNPRKVSSLTLVNATTDTDIGPLTDGYIIDLDQTGPVNVRANVCTNSNVESVLFNLNGSLFNIENGMPYAFFWDNNGDYLNWKPNPGNYTIEAIPYSSYTATGTAGIGLSVNFTVVGSVYKRSGTSDGFSGISLSAYPNPFKDEITLAFRTSKDEAITLEIFNLSGKKVATIFDGEANGGQLYTKVFNPKDLEAGLYLYKLKTGSEVRVDKILLTK